MLFSARPRADGFVLLLVILTLLLRPLTLRAESQMRTMAARFPVRIYSVKPGLDYLYRQLPPSHTYLFPLTDLRSFSSVSFRPRNLPVIGALAVSTALLVYRDEAILSDANRLGDQWGIAHTNQQARLVDWRFEFGGRTIDASPHVPQDLETGMYYLGDGLLHSTLGLGLWGYGSLRHNERAAQTGVQVVEVMVCTCIATQVLKHAFGRESPMAATETGGKWQLLPDPVEYANHPPRFDAMPSGHVATAMGTITVLADNYPEQRWIRPVGYSLMGVLMFAMLNNGVHWASDYPVGIAIGYAMAKAVDARSRTLFTDPAEGRPLGSVWTTHVTPYAGPDGGGLTWSIDFR